MQLPNIIHPKTCRITGYRIRVASYMPLTDAQAMTIAMHAFRSRKWTKKDLKLIHTELWLGQESDLAMLG